MARLIAGIAGVACGIAGLVTLWLLLFGPGSRYVKDATTCTSFPNGVTCTSTGLDHITTGAITIDIFPLSIGLLGTVALLFAVVAVSAALHSLTRGVLWLACLWAAAGLLVILAPYTVRTLALAPALALAVVAAGAAWIAVRQQTYHDPRRRLAPALEAVCGIGAGLLGAVASAYLLIAPNQSVTQSVSCDAQGACHAVSTGSPSPLAANPAAALVGGAVALAFFGLLALCAVRHSYTGKRVWFAWLAVGCLLLLLLSILGALSIGTVYLPSALLALFAVVSGFVQTRQRRATER
jgi:hypothetical protein